MEGNLETINIENNTVVVDGQLYALMDRVKPSFLKIGKVEYNLTNGMISYVRSLAPMNYPQQINNRTVLTKYFEGEDGEKMSDEMNEFSKQNDVKATQTHVVNGRHCAYVYYVATLMDL